MKRNLFMAAAAAAGAIAVSRALPARSEDLKRIPVETNVGASGRSDPLWYCESAIVWLDGETGIYYYKGDRCYGRTKRGAYACEKEAIAAGNRASLDSR